MAKLHQTILTLACMACVSIPAVAATYIPESPRLTNATYDPQDNVVTVTAEAPVYTEFDWDTYLQEELPYISYVKVERHLSGTSWYDADYVIGRVEEVEPGKMFTFVDNNVERDRKYEYKLTCYVDENHGTSSYANVYTGVNPGIITAFTATTPDHLSTFVDFSVTAPSLSDKGVELTSSLTIEIQSYADWTWSPLHSIEDVAPGETVTWQLTDLELNKSYHFRAVAKSGTSGVGEGLEADVYLGLDIPGIPENLTCTSMGESVLISWDAPAKGQRGGCYDPENTTYRITRRLLDGTSQTAAEEVSGNEYVDEPGFAEEASVTYEVLAINQSGESTSAAVHQTPVSVGPPAALPFNESFAANRMSHPGWIVESTQDDPYYTYEAWEFIHVSSMYHLPSDEYLTINPQDNDKGMASCKFYGYCADGQTESLISPRIDTDGIEEVVFSFWYYDVCSEASQNVVRASISRNGGEWEEIFLSEPEDETLSGWREVNVPLTLDGACTTMRTRIDAVRHDGPITNVFIDNISLTKSASSTADITVDPETAPEYFNLQGMRVDTPSTPGVYVVRRGTETSKIVVR